MPVVLPDTGVWYALFDSRDPHFEDVGEKSKVLETYQALLPWPVAYETLRTRFVRNRPALTRFEAYVSGPRVTYVDDGPYRDDALRLALDSSLRQRWPLSTVDCVIRLILGDRGLAIHALLTFNIADFADVCRDRGIEIV